MTSAIIAFCAHLLGLILLVLSLPFRIIARVMDAVGNCLALMGDRAGRFADTIYEVPVGK